MAAARGRVAGGVSGATVGLVVFAILTVALLVATILLWTQNTDLELARQEALDAKRVLASEAEEQSEALKTLRENAQKEPEKPSVLGYLLKQNKTLKEVVVGKGDLELTAGMVRRTVWQGEPGKEGEVPDPAVEERKVVGGTPLWTAYQTRLAELAVERQKIGVLEGERDRAKEEKTQLEEQLKQVRGAFDAARKDLESQIAARDSELKAARGGISEAIAPLEAHIKSLQTQLQKTTDDHRRQADSMQLEIAKRDAKIREMEDILKAGGGMEGPDLSLQADGAITAVSAVEQVVYINLGRQNRLQLGLPFEVYDRNTLPGGGPTLTRNIERQQGRKPRTEELQGKATIEVVAMGETTATCRVVRQTRGRGISQGDLIANVAFDPNLVFRFLIYGDFDLDNAGSVNPADNRRLENLVRIAGAKLMTKLSPQVDFLVLGFEPEDPGPARTTTDTDELQRYEKQKQKWEQYQQVLAEAKALGVRILDQNRFLAMAGYYQMVPGRGEAGSGAGIPMAPKDVPTTP